VASDVGLSVERVSHPIRLPSGSINGVRSVPEVLAMLFLCSILLGQIAKVPLVSSGIKTAPVLLSDMLAVALCLWLIASVLIVGRLRLDLVGKLLGAFVGVNILAIVVAALRYDLSGVEVVFSSLYLARWTLYALLYLFALGTLKTSSAVGLTRTAITVCLLFAGFGIFQSVFLPDFAFIIYPDAIPYVDWDVQGHRLVSSFLDPNFAGAFIIFGLLFAHAKGAVRGRQSYPLLAVFWVALILTLSRSSIIAMLIGLAMLTLRTRSFQRLFLPLAGVAIVGVLAAGRLLEFAARYNKLTLTDPSALSRLASWLLAWRIFADNPLIGVGFNTFGFVRASYGSMTAGNAAFGSDGGLLYIASVSGVVGLGILGAVLWRLMVTGARTYRVKDLPPNVRVLGLTLHAWVPSLVVHSAASNSIFYPLVIGPLFLLGGVCAQQYYAHSTS
jgi:hypothetical protein